MSVHDWQQKVFETALRGEDWNMTLILKAAFAWNTGPQSKPPAFGPSCVITPDGYMLTNYIDRSGHVTIGHCFARVEDFVDNLRRLAEAAHLSGKEVDDFFAEMRLWVKEDHRPASASEVVQPD